MQQPAVQCGERAVEVDREVIRGVRNKHARGIGLIQIQIPRGFSPQINSSQQGQGFAEAVGVKHVLGIHIAMFTLSDQPVAEVWPNVEGVITVKPGKLKLTVVSEMPYIVED